jgi:hypothetical protein
MQKHAVRDSPRREIFKIVYLVRWSVLSISTDEQDRPDKRINQIDQIQ